MAFRHDFAMILWGARKMSVSARPLSQMRPAAVAAKPLADVHFSC
jgi:hypothetical protein